jgi:hypothetical protein
MEGPTIFYLGEESLSLYNSTITDLLMPLLIPLAPPRVTHHEHQIILQAAMEENGTTSSGSLDTPSTTATTWGIPPPKSPSQVRATISTASTLGSGLILSMATITTLFTQSATSTPFPYGMPNFDTNSVLSYSTPQTLGLGEGSSNAPLQGPMGGTSTPYKYFT